jgi:membrane protein DedA with SNARE-associated domain
MPYFKFLISDAVAALISVPGWITLGYLGSAHLDRILRGVAQARHIAGFAIIVLILVAAVIIWLSNLYRRSRVAPPAAGGTRSSAEPDGNLG